ncbi:MAG TPA: hypothetical protein VJ692_09115 [Nitrospiraceae bacterium]|nr:hypothetical protein [Nitrospiraceae bacterium]
MKLKKEHNKPGLLIAPPRIDGAEAERLMTIVRPTRPIPIEKTLTGRTLVLDIENLRVVLTGQQARRLAYSLLLEAESLG